MKTQHITSVWIVLLLLTPLLFSCDDPASPNGSNPVPQREWLVIDVGGSSLQLLFPHPVQSNLMYASRIAEEYRQQLVRSDDGGMMWEVVIDSFELDGISFNGPDPNGFYITGEYQALQDDSYSRLWFTTDGGQTLDSCACEPRAMSSVIWVDPSDVNHLWESTGSMWEINDLLESTDGGDSWSQVRPDVFYGHGVTGSLRIWGIWYIEDDPSKMTVFAGPGQINSGLPMLFATEDRFESWTVLRQSAGSSMTLAFDPEDPATIVVGEALTEAYAYDSLSISRDGGVSWEGFARGPDVGLISGIELLGDSLYGVEGATLWAANLEDQTWTINRKFAGESKVFLSSRAGALYITTLDGSLFYKYN